MRTHHLLRQSTRHVCCIRLCWRGFQEHLSWKNIRYVMAATSMTTLSGTYNASALIWFHPQCTQGAVTYQLPPDEASWSTVFRELERNKNSLGIIDYSVSQTSLEQVQCILWHCTKCKCKICCMHFHCHISVFRFFFNLLKFKNLTLEVNCSTSNVHSTVIQSYMTL